MAIAYEDIRLVPSSALLYELQQVELELLEIISGDRPVPMDVDNTTDSCPEQTSTEPEPVYRSISMVLPPTVKVPSCTEQEGAVR